MTSNPDTHARLNALLDHLLALPETEREAHLLELECSAPEDARALREWLRGIARSDGYLEDPRSGPQPRSSAAQAVGPWRVLRRIGSGGMGEVWLGERADGAFTKYVAVKFILADSARLRASLESERSLLAGLEHPGIARLLDGGVTADGKPFLVTEYIDGERIDHWCRDHGADIRQRLALFRQVCDAVAHAHANLIVHRDIKPGNVLVDREGRAYLLDLGIARLLRSDTQAQRTAEAALTPNFAAPEQLADAAYTTRTDIYALGALLYLLICGKPPLETHDLTLEELVKRVTWEMPAPPSRHAEARLAIPRALAHDVDAIALKALAKAPQDRYPSVEACMADIDNALHSRAVTAHRGAGTSYRFKLFVRRNRLACALGAVIALAVIAGIAGTLWQARRAGAAAAQAQAAARRAEDEARTANAATEFLVSIFEAASPGQALGKMPDAMEILGEGVKRVDAELGSQPELRARLYDALALTYAELGKADLAVGLFNKGIDLATAQFGANAPVTERMVVDLASVYAAGRSTDAAVAARLREVIARQKVAPKDSRVLLVKALVAQGMIEKQNASPQAVATLQEAVALAREQDSGGRADLFAALNALAQAYHSNGNAAASVAPLREALSLGETIYDARNPQITATKSVLAMELYSTGNMAESEPLLRSVEESQRLVLGDNHPTYAGTLYMLSYVLARNGKFDEAEGYAQKALDIAAKQPNPEAREQQTGEAMVFLARIRFERGDYPAAADLERQALAGFRRRLGPAHETTLLSMSNLASYAMRSGNYAEGRDLLLQRRSANRASPGADGGIDLYNLARAQRLLGQPGEAAKSAAEALLATGRNFGEHSESSADARSILAQALRDLGRHDEARGTATQALDDYLKLFGAADPRVGNTRYLIAQLDYLQGRCAEESLAALSANWERRKKQKQTQMQEWQAAEAGLMVGLCQRQLRPHDTAASDKLVAASARVLRNNPLADPYFKMLADGASANR